MKLRVYYDHEKIVSVIKDDDMLLVHSESDVKEGNEGMKTVKIKDNVEDS